MPGCATIIIFRKSMSVFSWVLWVCLVSQTLSGSDTINPSNYIWINYKEQVPILLNQKGQYQSQIPCKARIGKCKCNYSVLPLGWSKAEDSTVIIKNDDVLKGGFFAVQGEFKEITGQKLTADLVVIIKDQRLSVMDSIQYYSQIGYKNQKASGSRYEVSPLIKEIPDGFPSLNTVEDKLKSGSPKEIEKMIDQLVARFAPCRSKINYFKSVKDIFRRLIDANNDKLNNQKQQIADLEKKLVELNQKKRSILKEKGIDQQIDKINAQIMSLNRDYATYKTLEINNSILRDQAQKKMRNHGQGEQKTMNKKTQKMLEEIESKFNKWLIRAIEDRSILRKGIFQIRLLKQTKGISNRPEVKELVKIYKNSISSMVDAESKLTVKQIKMEDLAQEKQENNNFLMYIQQLMSLVESPSTKAGLTEKASKLQEENRILGYEINNLQQKLGKMAVTCF